MLTLSAYGEGVAKRINCPACGARGEVGDDVTFEIRGRFQGRAVQKCLNCGSGVFVKPPFARTEIIPHELWQKMQERWAKEFGEDEDHEAEDEYPVVAEAVQALFDECPDGLAASVFVLASAAQDVAGAALRLVARKDPEWANLDAETAKAVIRCGATYFVLAATQDDTLKRYFSDWLDLRPSEVPASVLAAYTEAFLPAVEARLVATVKKKWDDEDSDGYSMAIGRMMWRAGGGEGAPPIDDVMQWRLALHTLRESFDQHFMVELERFAQE
jgi:hypothetical protein